MFEQNTLRLNRRRLSFNQKREIHIMSKKLVAYFSVSGVTEKVAKELAKVENADLFAITPVQPYTKEDLDYTNPNSRSSVEMKDLNCRPELSAKLSETGYDTVFVGFPIWWGREPSAVDTFLTENDFTARRSFRSALPEEARSVPPASELLNSPERKPKPDFAWAEIFRKRS